MNCLEIIMMIFIFWGNIKSYSYIHFEQYLFSFILFYNVIKGYTATLHACVSVNSFINKIK